MKLRSPSRAAYTLTFGMVLLVATAIAAQKLTHEKNPDEETAKLVCELVSRFHIARPKIDDAVSLKLLKRYLEVIDPQKMYLLKSDIVSMEKYRTELDDFVKNGDVRFAYDTWNTYLNRLDERIVEVHTLIDAEYDFTTDESMFKDTGEFDWAKDKVDLDKRWRKRIKYDLLDLRLSDEKLGEARKRLHRRYRMFQRSERLSEDREILENYLSALTHCFDPHSSYMSPLAYEEFRIGMELSLEGIGAALRSKDGYTIVAQIVPGGAADQDKRLQVGDKIVAVGQELGEMVDIIEMKLSKVVRLIRGPKTTKVRLQVKKGDSGETVLYILIRQKIELKSSAVKGESINTTERIKGRTARIGVIRIPSFYRDFSREQQGLRGFKSTARDLQEVLVDLSNEEVDAIIVDLRTNGGGSLREAIEVAGLFIDEGPVVQVKEQNGKIKPHDDEDSGMLYDGPLVVLCNRLSASASEIVAGVIKDYARGIVVGDITTHGKGTVQNVMRVRKPFSRIFPGQDRGALKLTINKFYRVNGHSTQKHGVSSDIVLPSILDHMELGESFLDNTLGFDKVNPAAHRSAGMVTGDIITRLQMLSKRRVAAHLEFQKLQETINRFKAQKKQQMVSLNEKARREEQQEIKKMKKDNDDQDKAKQYGKGPVFPDNYYNNEVLQITLDYIELLNDAKTAKK